MVYFIIVREAEKEDILKQRELFYNSIMSYCTSAFFLFLFKEITFQFTVLVCAIMFIFVGVPLFWCILAVPIVACVVFLLTYATHIFKATEKNEMKPIKSWVAEAYEPYYLVADTSTLKYIVIDKSEMTSQNSDWERMRKKIVGTVSITDFHGPNHSVWLYGLAVQPGYRRKGIGRRLINAVFEYCKTEKIDSIEVCTSDLQNEARCLFQNSGFEMRQMYHKQLIGTVLTIAMFHQGYTLNVNLINNKIE